MPNAVVSALEDGDQVVAAPAGTAFIRVHGYVLEASGEERFQLQDGDGTPLMGVVTAAAAPVTPEGWFDLPAGKALEVGVTGAGTVSGHVRYSVRG